MASNPNMTERERQLLEEAQEQERFGDTAEYILRKAKMRPAQGGCCGGHAGGQGCCGRHQHMPQENE